MRADTGVIVIESAWQVRGALKLPAGNGPLTLIISDSNALIALLITLAPLTNIVIHQAYGFDDLR